MTELADSILQKISTSSSTTVVKPVASNQLDPKIVEVYEKVGLVLSRYKSGKLPKAFKVIPTLKNWEEVLVLTAPEKWTPNAMFEATKIFSSNLPPKMVDKFYRHVLLENVRNEFNQEKNINVHHFQALKKATYKPVAFFKGIIFPIVSDPSTTLKEANIFCSIISGTSIPVLHAAGALLKIASGEYSGPRFMMLRCLLEKKYALPTKAVEHVFKYFGSFVSKPEALPVLWHQALLVFVQRYKLELVGEKKNLITKLVEVHNHASITPEVLRELC